MCLGWAGSTKEEYFLFLFFLRTVEAPVVSDGCSSLFCLFYFLSLRTEKAVTVQGWSSAVLEQHCFEKPVSHCLDCGLVP